MYNNHEDSFACTLRKIVGSYVHIRLIMILSGIVIAVTMFTFVCIYLAAGPDQYTETTDPEEYGNYIGTSSPTFTKNFINSFFPEDDINSLNIIKYSYKAENIDTYGFEAYLECTIEDTDEFNSYIDTIADEHEWEVFQYDKEFYEYSIENVLEITPFYPEDATNMFYHQIHTAKIRKVLINPQSNLIIFVAIGVHDGGGVGTNYLNEFFDRFNIDPVEYAMTADSSYGVDPYGID